MPTVLHLAGSRSSAFYAELSLVYARSALVPPSLEHVFAVVEPGGGWRVGPGLDDLGPVVGTSDLIAGLGPVDLVVPYMFDPAGMTSYRSFFEDVLGIPVVGSPASVTTIATSKALTKSVLESAGVPVPASWSPSEAGDHLPVVVKPDREDNSRGLSLVTRSEELGPAVDDAAGYGAGVLIEEFVDGHEIRVAVVDHDGELYVPAMIEYVVSAEAPMRMLEHKLVVDDRGAPEAQATGTDIDAICPAVLSPGLRAEIERQARLAHRALGCRDYSLFDLRVDERTGEPRFLEAGLFWTFGPISMISRMIEADGRSAADVALGVWQQAMTRAEHGVRQLVDAAA